MLCFKEKKYIFQNYESAVKDVNRFNKNMPGFPITAVIEKCENHYHMNFDRSQNTTPEDIDKTPRSYQKPPNNLTDFSDLSKWHFNRASQLINGDPDTEYFHLRQGFDFKKLANS
tara:strand:+ start:402 stop:746 length:345 start_codon:yes stop_codon:yes gene_type:complete